MMVSERTPLLPAHHKPPHPASTTSTSPVSLPSLLLQYHALRTGHYPSQEQANAIAAWIEKHSAITEVNDFVHAARRVGTAKNADDKLQSLLYSLANSSSDPTTSAAFPTSDFYSVIAFILRSIPLSTFPRAKAANLAKNVASAAQTVHDALEPPAVEPTITSAFVKSNEGESASKPNGSIPTADSAQKTVEAERVLDAYKSTISSPPLSSSSSQLLLQTFRTFLLQLRLDPDPSYKSSFLSLLAWIDSPSSSQNDTAQNLHDVLDALPEQRGMWESVRNTSAEQVHDACVAIVKALEEEDVDYLRTEGLDEELGRILDGSPLLDYCVAVARDEELNELVKSSMRLASAVAGLREKSARDMAVEWGPRVLESIEYVPLPRLEFASEELELVVDSFNLYSPIHFFVPAHLHVHNKTSFDFFRAYAGYATQWETGVDVDIRGVQMQARDIAFYVRYKGLGGWLDIEEDGMLDFNFGGLEGRAEGKDSDGFEVKSELKFGEGAKLFDVEKLQVKLRNFDYKIHDSSHPIRNFLLRPLMRPIISYVVQSALESALTSALSSLTAPSPPSPAKSLTSLLPSVPTFSTTPQTHATPTHVTRKPADRSSLLTFSWAPSKRTVEGWTPARKRWEHKVEDVHEAVGTIYGVC
ncbi:hypothetical protein BT69DRAFT_42054 [Atractiella rhizophila]|nr:hypothetical protein BT69DRAFT_42054 [Atractiella rhizophila]